MSDVKRLGSVGTDDDGKCAAERETTEMKDEDTEMIDKQAEFVEFQGKVFEGLTDDQKKAVYTDGKVLVTAAAGTGKTRSMIGRIVGKVMKGVPIRRILVLVFNEAAAAEIDGVGPRGHGGIQCLRGAGRRQNFHGRRQPRARRSSSSSARSLFISSR